MKKSYRFLIAALFLGAYLLSACNGELPPQDDSPQGSTDSSEFTEAVFTGTVESLGGGQWLIGGQQVTVDDSTSVSPDIQVGDIVKVEVSVSADGSVIALKIESANPDDANDNDSNVNDDNTNSGNDNENDNSNANSNDSMGDDQEIHGVVDAVTDDSVTVDGVVYSIADFTEFKSLVAVGDQVKVEFTVNADGTFTIHEIEKSSSIGDENSNDGNANYNKNSNDEDHSNGNSDDDDDDNSNSNSNDDDEHDDDNDNSNDSNSNDD